MTAVSAIEDNINQSYKICEISNDKINFGKLISKKKLHGQKTAFKNSILSWERERERGKQA